MRTLKELAQEAIDVQNASNLTGILLGAHRAPQEVRPFFGGRLGGHPIMKLWACKIADMTGIDHLFPSDAYNECLILASDTLTAIKQEIADACPTKA